MSNSLQHPKRSLATTSMIVAMAIFGSIGFIAAQTGLQAFELVFVRCVCASLFLGAVWLLSGKFKNENWDKREVKRVLLCGLILVLNWVFLFKAFELMPITVAISIYYLAPVIVLLLGSLLYKEKLTLLAIISILICFIGTMLISGLGTDIPFQELLSSGLILPFLAAILYALLTLLSKGIHKLSPYAVTVMQTTLGAILLFPLVSLSAFSGLQVDHWIAITIIGVIHTGVVYFLFFGSVRYLPTRLIAALVFLDPIVAILLDTMIIGFRPSSLQIVGLFLTFCGMAFTLVRTKPTKSSIEAS